MFQKNDDGCPQVTIRVSVEDKKLIKKYGGNFADIWRLGFDKWIENIPAELQKKASFYQNLLLQCNNNLKECNNNVTTENDGYEQLKQKYLKRDRSVISESQDKFWIKTQCKGNKLSVEKFMKYLDGEKI